MPLKLDPEAPECNILFLFDAAVDPLDASIKVAILFSITVPAPAGSDDLWSR